MIRQCAWCKKILGEKEPIEDKRTTHTICEKCCDKMEEENQIKPTETWFLLYGGSSPDGRGRGRYIGRTTDKDMARKHYEACKKNPYSTGYVHIVNDIKQDVADLQTDWEKL